MDNNKSIMEECPFTVTREDGTVIQLKWRKKINKQPIVFKIPKTPTPPPSPPKPKKLISEKEYIIKCLNSIKKDLNIMEAVVFRFYEFKDIPLLSIKQIKNIYTLNLNKMVPTKNSKIQIGISEKNISKLKNILSRIEINNKSFSL